MPVKTGIQEGRMPCAPTEILGLRVAVAIASLPGMTPELFNDYGNMTLVIFLEVHSLVQTCHLLTVAVEHERLSAKKFADAPFAGLAPARMIDFRIDIRVKAVFLGLHHVPRRGRLLLDEAQFDNRLDALKAVLPRHDQAHRGAVLRRQNFAIQADREKRQRMHGFVHAQSLDVRPLERAAKNTRLLTRHTLGVMERDELNEFSVVGRLHLIDQGTERKPYPRYHHRPGFDAA